MKKIIKKIKELIRQFIYGKYSMEYYRIELQEKINELKITPYDIAKIFIQMYNDNYGDWGLGIKEIVGLEKIQLLTAKTISAFEFIYEVYLVDTNEHKCYIYNNKYIGYEDIRRNFDRSQIKDTRYERKENILNSRLKKIKKLFNDILMLDYNYSIFSSYYYYDLAYHMIPRSSKIREISKSGKNIEIPRKYFLEISSNMTDLKNTVEKNIKEKLEKQRKRKKSTKNKKKKTIIKKDDNKKEEELGEEVF